MQYKSTIIALALICSAAAPAAAQTVTRWNRIPANGGTPQTIRHPLERADQPGELFRFSYETPPVTTMMRRIRYGFSELFPEPVPELNEVDISRATQMLEELDNEADSALELGYDTLDLSKELSIFDPDRVVEEKASDSLELPETSDLQPATVTFPIGEN